MSESEYGKGLVLCLVKFAEHRMKLKEDLSLYKEMEAKHPGSFSESGCIEMHFNGASDHLYEIEVPGGEEWDYIREKVDRLKDKGLEIGHGFTGKIWTVEDATELYSLAEEIAILIDKKLGLEPGIGQW